MVVSAPGASCVLNPEVSGSYSLGQYLDTLKLATEIHLDDPQTQQGLQALVAAGLLFESRVAEILA